MYLAVVAAAGVAALILATYSWGLRRSPGYTHFAITELATAWWITCYLAEHLDPTHALHWFPLKFPAVAAIPPAWLLFAANQVGYRPAARHVALAYSWPVLIGPILATNEWHQLMFRGIDRRGEILGVAGPLFNFHFVLSYAVFIAAEVILFRDWWRRGTRQSVLLGIGGLIPFSGNVAFELAVMFPQVGRVIAYDTTLPGFALSALFTGWATIRYQLLDPGPIARETLFEWLPDLVFVLNEQEVVVDANQAALVLLGSSRRMTVGQPWQRLFAGGASLGAHDAEGGASGDGDDATGGAWHTLPTAGGPAVERRWVRGGVETWFELQSRTLHRHGGRTVGTLIVGRDVTTRRLIEVQLRSESRRDGLTGLSNRRHFEDEAARLRASREFPVAIFAFDLDGLKAVNDGEGHAAGDELLRAMAAFLAQFFRAGDRVFRLGGDEFLVVLPSTNTAETERIVERLPEACEQFNGRHPRPIRFSTGVAVAEEPAAWAAALALADERLYEAKRSQQGKVGSTMSR